MHQPGRMNHHNQQQTKNLHLTFPNSNPLTIMEMKLIGKRNEMDLILLKERVMEVGDIVQKIEQDQTHPNSAFGLEKMAKNLMGWH